MYATHPKVVCDGLTYPRVACLGGMLSRRRELLRNANWMRRLEATMKNWRLYQKDSHKERFLYVCRLSILMAEELREDACS